jgi:hypothetical protein
MHNDDDERPSRPTEPRKLRIVPRCDAKDSAKSMREAWIAAVRRVELEKGGAKP